MNDNLDSIEIIAFDVFGTVVDWHGTVAREVGALELDVDPGEFALAWRAGYQPAMREVMDRGEWVILDELHRRILDRVLDDFGIDLPEAGRAQLNRVWHRLDPWPDSVEGLTRLKSKYIISTLSNGNIGLLAEMAKLAGLPWDVILCAETFRKYKPHPDTYLGVARTFDLEPGRVMLAAAHHGDLEAARNCGLQTAYIERPWEYGRDEAKKVEPREANTLHARNIVDLAGQLGC
ncbi:MAG: haloacid dehalogenase type II [Gammaproteobacteria bacterium]|jgi:2-haloacid dehalogenase